MDSIKIPAKAKTQLLTPQDQLFSYNTLHQTPFKKCLILILLTGKKRKEIRTLEHSFFIFKFTCDDFDCCQFKDGITDWAKCALSD